MPECTHMSESEQLALVLEVADPIEFSLAENVLEQAEIPFVAQSTGGAGAAAIHMGPGVGRLQSLWVHPRDEERALEALEVLRNADEGGEPRKG